MDFASLMSKEISKSSGAAPKKYLRRAELEAEREAAYIASQKALQVEREEKVAKKRKLEEEEAARNQEREAKRNRLAEESRKRREEEDERKEKARRRRLGLPDLPPRAADGSGKEDTPLPEGEEDIHDADLITKLRALNEPARLFGESHKSRLRRYRRLTSTAKDSSPDLTPGPIPTSLLPVPEADMKLPATLPTDPAGLTFLYRQLASYFTLVLTEWGIALSQRPESVKGSFQGKAAYTAMVQAKENMRPLFKRFERGDLEIGVLAPVVEIVRAAQERRYVDANDGYLTLSIGKAAWPIGVTMVGIHERSAREKLHESGKGQAHIMSDEVTRKFLQSIKRCLSFAQTRWPPADQLQLMG
ncbi:MAG: mRNA splicing protein prp18 [Geoglossum simile]|nr:MAG: mRNA splicing protein prp18 [Geoglossum simile]